MIKLLVADPSYRLIGKVVQSRPNGNAVGIALSVAPVPCRHPFKDPFRKYYLLLMIDPIYAFLKTIAYDIQTTVEFNSFFFC